MSSCIHCNGEADGLFLVPDGDYYLCNRCYENMVDFVGDPAEHDWRLVETHIEGRNANDTFLVERCRICGNLRVDDSVEVVEVTSDRDKQDEVNGKPSKKRPRRRHGGKD